MKPRAQRWPKRRPKGMPTKEWFDTLWIGEPNSGCWLWLAGMRDGYGAFRMQHGREPVVATKASYTLYRGEVPEGVCVLHKCDTPACVNPQHLFLGTRADNIADMMRKGRHCYGPLKPRHPGAHLPRSGHANSAKTHCRNGHPFTEENTRIEIGASGPSRRCVTCLRDWRARQSPRREAIAQ